jgi:hypothetical protein
MNDQS